MKTPFVSELQPNQVVTAVFLVQQKDIRQKRSGEPYLSLLLADRTGELEAKMWDNASEVMDTFERDDFLKVRGLMQVHQNRLQLTVHKLQKQSESEVDAADFFPASRRNPSDMLQELRSLIAGLNSIPLRDLLTAIFDDPEISSRYMIAPAAKSVHHAYLGGLLEHVLSMCKLARAMADHYENIDLDLLLTGAIVHDLGKIHELTYDRSFSYSTSGQLLGHIVIGLQMLDEKIRLFPDFPKPLRMMIEHMLISHHGELEFGSPRVPLFPEALLLHHLDNLDSKMECMRAAIEKDRLVEGCWTGYNSVLERIILKKAKFLDAPADSAVTAGPATEAPAATGSPGASAATAAAHPGSKPASNRAGSMFAEKLRGALDGSS